MEELVACLKEKHLTIGSCESFTAGLFCSKIADISGASAVLKGGIVTYATSIKFQVAHVDQQLVEHYGVVSSQCAIDMAEKARHVLGVDICVSFTGNAGPSRLEGKRAGEVYCAIAMSDHTHVYHYIIEQERNQVREEAVQRIKDEVLALLNNG